MVLLFWNELFLHYLTFPCNSHSCNYSSKSQTSSKKTNQHNSINKSYLRFRNVIVFHCRFLILTSHFPFVRYETVYKEEALLHSGPPLTFLGFECYSTPALKVPMVSFNFEEENKDKNLLKNEKLKTLSSWTRAWLLLKPIQISIVEKERIYFSAASRTRFINIYDTV